MSNYKHNQKFFLILLIYLFVEVIILQKVIYIYFNGIISELFFLLVLFIPCIAITNYISFYKETFEEYGFHIHNPLIQLLYGIGLYAFIGLIFRSNFSSLPAISNSIANIIDKFNSHTVFNTLNIFFNALSEELIWRGFILKFLTQKNSIFCSIIITSILFGVMHFPVSFSFLQVINSCVISIVYCFLRIHSPEKFSIFSLTITHFLWNSALY